MQENETDSNIKLSKEEIKKRVKKSFGTITIYLDFIKSTHGYTISNQQVSDYFGERRKAKLFQECLSKDLKSGVL